MAPRPAKAKRGRLIDSLLYVWRHRVTAAGRWLLPLLMVGGSVATVLGPSYPLYHLIFFLYILSLIASLATTFVRPRLKVERRLPERCAAGETLIIHAKVHNPRGPVYDWHVAENIAHPDAFVDPVPDAVDKIGRAESRDHSYTIKFLRRGLYESRGPAVLTAFPLGLYHTAQEIKSPAKISVHPPFTPLDQLHLPVARRHQPGGLSFVSAVGDSAEYAGNREYRPGDRLRDLDQRAFARTGQPIVREYREEYLARVCLICDTYIPGWKPRRYGLSMLHADFEASLSVAATCADALSRQDYVMELFAAGPEIYNLRFGRSLAYLDSVLDVLACLEPCAEDPYPRLTPAVLDALEGVATAVVILLDLDPPRLVFLAELQSRGLVIKPILVRGSPPSHALALGCAADLAGLISLAPADVARGLRVL